MILQPGHNIWRLEHAFRAAVLIDAAAYFGAVREAMLKAHHSVFIIGWDIHSQTRLVGESGKADDGYPDVFADFLSALVHERPELVVSLLLWDYSVLYATERELFPTLTLRWNTPSRVRFCLDDAVPIGSSQHQKLIVIDDAVAFSGGLDVTIRRWDTSAHAAANPLRVDNTGKPYKPFHDVQALVDGPAARALAELVRARWRCACSESSPLVDAPADPWPDSVRPDFTDVRVGISRTQPRYEAQEEVREVEALFLDSLAAAERTIYIENQYLTCTKFAERLVRRLRERPTLEAVIVAPQGHDAWLEAHSMRNGRIRFLNILQQGGVGGRVRLLYPEVRDRNRSVATMVHSKVMVVDDRFLRIGSANLNNRSMGIDTECDLAIEAGSEHDRERIRAVRDRLVADHCGAQPGEVAAALSEGGSLIAVAENLSRNGHRLRRIDDGAPDLAELSAYIEGVADPERPIGAEELVSTMFGGYIPQGQASAVVKVVLAALVVLLLGLIWHFTPLASLAEPEVVRDVLAAFSEGPWGLLVVLMAFIAGGLLLFPVTILIAATAAAFGPWLGFAYATMGALASAVITYGLGAKLGKESLRDFLGPRLNRIREKIARRGVIAVASIRLVPLAPFTVVNLVAGASEIKFLDYVAGTLLGLAPGLILMSALGHQISRIITDPTPADFALLTAAVLAWIGVSIGVQVLVSKLWSEKS
jgi:phospholipase D1/2